ncbi:TolB-like translocation protein [Nocardioides pantholopis]|uniref:hypothetical protein n=1 Tax=Nocardioides pantholopis TaxID=2483798 RepID=UPI000F0931D6|nr:hypothetical protein [Nocardioides pantholopis]
MSTRARIACFVVLTAVVLTGTTVYALQELDRSRTRERAAPSVPGTDLAAPGPVIAFRHTGADREHGVVATVPLADPDGPRAYTDVVCDRVDASPTGASCLTTERGVVTRYRARDLDRDWRQVHAAALPGPPSRTRRSPDGSLVATTSFVTGHSYLAQGFSTATVVRSTDGTRNWGNLEGFRLRIDGEQAAPRDRNLWGVTFAADDRTFYVTLATGGRTYLARGDLDARTLSTVAVDVECPALSPDGARIAFKHATGSGSSRRWTPAVLDLATGRRTVLAGEERHVDDQLAWLDGDTVLYGLPRADEAGVSDVWSLDVDPAAEPRLLIEQAWSPAVVR